MAFSFGATGSTTTPKSTFSFGAKPTTPTGTTGATGSTTRPASTPSTFSFGGVSSGSTASKPTTGLFSATPGAGTTSGSATGALFGGAGATTNTGGLFGQTNQPFSFTTPQQAAQQASSELEQKLMQLMLAYDRSQEWFAFRFMLYNFVDNAAAYEKPGNVHPVLWQQAVAQNPDPTRLVPVEAKGFADLKERADSQDVATRKHIEVLNGISDVLRSLRQRHEVSTLSKLEQYTKRHHDLSRRLIALQRKLELIAARGQGIGANEEAFASHVATLLSRLSRPDQFAGRLSQLAADVRLRAVGADDATLAQTELPAEALDDICEALQHMTSGISVLTKTLEKDVEDLRVIESGMAHLAPTVAEDTNQMSGVSGSSYSRW